MPIYITQGRYTREAIKGMIVKPEDRAEAISRLIAKVGGRLIGFYLTFGEYDFPVDLRSTRQHIGRLGIAGGRKHRRRHRPAHHRGDDGHGGARRLCRRRRYRDRIQIGGRYLTPSARSSKE
jgi:hypothetical protein